MVQLLPEAFTAFAALRDAQRSRLGRLPWGVRRVGKTARLLPECALVRFQLPQLMIVEKVSPESAVIAGKISLWMLLSVNSPQRALVSVARFVDERQRAGDWNSLDLLLQQCTLFVDQLIDSVLVCLASTTHRSVEHLPAREAFVAKTFEVLSARLGAVRAQHLLRLAQ